MSTVKQFKDYRSRPVGLALSLLLMFVGASAALAQNKQSSPEQGLTMSRLLKLPGKVIAEGSNTRAGGKFRAASYRVEEVPLPNVVEVKIKDKLFMVDKAYRVTVTGGPFAVRAMPAVIWIDDVAIGYGVENEDLTEITAVTLNSYVLVDGASIFISYGDKGNKEGREALPEKLKLNSPE
jgi:hypothetical protein